MRSIVMKNFDKGPQLLRAFFLESVWEKKRGLRLADDSDFLKYPIL